MNLMVLPLWAWIVFYVLVLLMLVAMNEYVNSLGALAGLQLDIPHIEVPTPVSLAVIFGVLALSMLLSFAVTRQKQH